MLLSHSFLWVRKFENNLASDCGPGLLIRILAKMSARAAVIWRFDQGYTVCTSKTVHSDGWQVDANCLQEVSVLSHRDLPYRHVWVSLWHGSWLPPEQVTKTRMRQGSTFSYDLNLEVIHHHFYHIPSSHRPIMVHCKRRIGEKMWIFVKCGKLGASWA